MPIPRGGFNPFAGRSYRLGMLDSDWPEKIESLLTEAFHAPRTAFGTFSMVTAIPNIVTHAFSNDWARLPYNLLSACEEIQTADWGQELYYLRKYGPRLFDRTGEIVRETVEDLELVRLRGGPVDEEYLKLLRIRHQHIPSYINSNVIKYDSHPFDDAVFEEWWNTINKPDFTGFALGQLASAWNGAIHQVKAEVPVVYEYEVVRDFLAKFNHPCWRANKLTQFV